MKLLKNHMNGGGMLSRDIDFKVGGHYDTESLFGHSDTESLFFLGGYEEDKEYIKKMQKEQENTRERARKYELKKMHGGNVETDFARYIKQKNNLQHEKNIVKNRREKQNIIKKNRHNRHGGEYIEEDDWSQQTGGADGDVVDQGISKSLSDVINSLTMTEQYLQESISTQNSNVELDDIKKRGEQFKKNFNIVNDYLKSLTKQIDKSIKVATSLKK